MKYLIVVLVALISCNLSYSQQVEKEVDIEIVKGKVLRHVVLFQWNEGTPEAKVTEIEEAFAALPGKIPEIMGFEFGLNNSPEGLNKEFTHCFLVTFADEKGREVYLPHPAHQEFVKLVGDHVKDVLVVDFWSE